MSIESLTGTSTILEFEHNIDADPLFVDAENLDYRLQENSPCIDAGDPNSPLDPDGTIADMGAYYVNQFTVFSPGDLNQDNTIDILDIVSMVNIILGEPPNEWEYHASDINSDTIIDILDIVQLVNIILENPS